MKEKYTNSILIVDDEHSNLITLCQILQEYTIYTAKNGSSAIEKATEYLPDLILLDIIMPDINGYEVLAILKQTYKTKNIPVIFITGLDSTADEEKGLVFGAVDYIAKPFNSLIVKLRVDYQLQLLNQLRTIEGLNRTNQQNLAKLETVINHYKGVIWSVNSSGVVTTFSGKYLKTLGIESAYLEGKELKEALPENWRLSLKILENIEKTFREGPQNWMSEIENRVYNSTTTPMYNSEGNIIGVVGSTDNVTETVKLHNDLEAALEDARTANHTKSTFLANMSHEIRSPMNVILGITEILLQNESLEPDLNEALCKIYNSGELLLHIINDILDLSKIEAGKLELFLAEYSIASLINDTVQLNMMRFENNPVKFTLQVDENIPSSLVGDELRIKQILNNLLSNAAKYTQRGEVVLSVSSVAASGGITLVFRVQDTGQGMTQEQVSKLFDDYTRFNVEANRTTEGTGLGMGITQNLVRMMNGSISIESEPDKGSIFTVHIPQGRINDNVLGKTVAENLQQFRTDSMPQIKIKQITHDYMPYGSVLVVDDMQSNLYVAKGLMLPYGLAVDTVTSGVEAIDRIRDGRVYDIIFMDHMMPKMDGIETTKKIRELGYTAPIISLTANAVAGQANVFLTNGFDDFISKPVDVREMDILLKKFVRDKQPPEVIEAAHLQKSSREETGKQAANTELWKKLEQIEGLQADIGLERVSGQRDIYEKSLQLLMKEIEKCDTNLKEFLAAGDLHNFSISVHGIKGSLANIGAMELSAQARKLELASCNEDAVYCTSNLQPFLEKLCRFGVSLAEIFAKEKDLSAAAIIIPPELPPVFERLTAALSETAFTAIHEGVKNLDALKLDGILKEEIEKIKDAVITGDYEEAIEIMRNLGK
ncbi:MAG: response regulator [Treponema sp.]|jgi:PAS domain S-box-containing protein|nr:response regulator [Treponema sp.]